MRAIVRTGWAVLTLVMVVGCGGGASDAPSTAEVTGTVTLDGQPVTEGFVEFTPDDSKGTTGPKSAANLDSSGKFSLLLAGGSKGAVVGHHKVSVKCPFDPATGSSASGQASGAPKPCKIPAKYSDPLSTPLTAEVKSGQANEIKLDLSTK